jgi:hypothetical protein
MKYNICETYTEPIWIKSLFCFVPDTSKLSDVNIFTVFVLVFFCSFGWNFLITCCKQVACRGGVIFGDSVVAHRYNDDIINLLCYLIFFGVCFCVHGEIRLILCFCLGMSSLNIIRSAQFCLYLYVILNTSSSYVRCVKSYKNAVKTEYNLVFFLWKYRYFVDYERNFI